MSNESKKPSVYGVMMSVITHLNSPHEQKNMAGNLAAIRNSIGKSYEAATGVWPILFPLIPQEYLGNGSLSYEEQALFVTLQLYAIGQQGSNKMPNDDENKSIGSSLQKIRQQRIVDGESTASLDKRFNTMLTSLTFEEFAYHLRQVFKLGKAFNGFSVNFPALANDLFWYQKGKNKQISLKWAKDYYKPEFPKKDS